MTAPRVTILHAPAPTSPRWLRAIRAGARVAAAVLALAVACALATIIMRVHAAEARQAPTEASR